MRHLLYGISKQGEMQRDTLHCLHLKLFVWLHRLFRLSSGFHEVASLSLFLSLSLSLPLLLLHKQCTNDEEGGFSPSICMSKKCLPVCPSRTLRTGRPSSDEMFP